MGDCHAELRLGAQVQLYDALLAKSNCMQTHVSCEKFVHDRKLANIYRAIPSIQVRTLTHPPTRSLAHPPTRPPTHPPRFSRRAAVLTTLVRAEGCAMGGCVGQQGGARGWAGGPVAP